MAENAFQSAGNITEKQSNSSQKYRYKKQNLGLLGMKFYRHLGDNIVVPEVISLNRKWPV